MFLYASVMFCSLLFIFCFIFVFCYVSVLFRSVFLIFCFTVCFLLCFCYFSPVSYFFEFYFFVLCYIHFMFLLIFCLKLNYVMCWLFVSVMFPFYVLFFVFFLVSDENMLCVWSIFVMFDMLVFCLFFYVSILFAVMFLFNMDYVEVWHVVFYVSVGFLFICFVAVPSFLFQGNPSNLPTQLASELGSLELVSQVCRGIFCPSCQHN